MSDVPPDERGESDAGWAAPELPPTEPQGPPDATASDATASDTSVPAAPPSAPATSPPPPAPAPAAPIPASAAGTPGASVKRRKTWLVVLLSVIGLGVVVAIAGTVLFIDRTVPPFDAANDFLDDLADRRVDQAADQLCASDRESPEQAIGEVTRRFPGGDQLFVNPLGVDRDGDRAWVEFTITARSDDDDDDRSYRLPLRQEDGDWRPCPGDGVEPS